jgi:hypothetical protein
MVWHSNDSGDADVLMYAGWSNLMLEIVSSDIVGVQIFASQASISINELQQGWPR